MWIERQISTLIKQQALTRPALLLTGPRQVGKSSLLQKLFPNATCLSFDDRSVALDASSSPETFLSRLSNQVILDEVQYVPEIFRDLKIHIDRHRNDRSRLLLLTGSQKFSLMKNASESLAGRISIFELQSLSAAELRNASISPVALVQRGGYPELWVEQRQSTRRYYSDYFNTYLERDVRSELNVNSLRDFDRCLRAIALRVGSLVNFADIGKDIGISPNTVKAWIGVLESSGIIQLLEPYFDNRNKRLIKAPKIYFCDNGLLCYLLQLRDDEDWRAHLLASKIWENFVFTELTRLAKLNGGDRSLFFWREKSGKEIDFLIEHSNRVELIEAKLAENPNPADGNFSLFTRQHSIPAEFYFACPTSRKEMTSLTKEHRVWNPLHCEGPLVQ
jgi:predicted AAA+ superfamily ATPase